MPKLTDIRLFGQAVVPKGAQEPATMMVAKGATITGDAHMNEEQWLNALVKAGHDPDVAKAAAKVFSDAKAEAGDVEKAFKSLKGDEEKVTEKSAEEPATDL